MKNNKLYCNPQNYFNDTIFDGNNWVRRFQPYNDFDFDKNGLLYYLSENHVFLKSSDEGASWDTINGNLRKMLDFNYSYVAGFCINNNNELIVNLNNIGFFKTYDQGKNWIQVKHVSSNINKFIKDQNIIYGISDVVDYKENNNFIFRSFDFGETWDSLKLSLPESSYHFFISNYGELFASDVGKNPTGLYRSTDYGSSWNKFDTDFDSKRITAVAFEEDGTMWCGTDSGSVYRSMEPVVSVDEQQIFENVILSPNPVHDFLYISGIINQKIEIFSVEGLKVFESIDPISKIDVSGLLPGVYFLKVGDKVSKFVKM